MTRHTHARSTRDLLTRTRTRKDARAYARELSMLAYLASSSACPSLDQVARDIDAILAYTRTHDDDSAMPAENTHTRSAHNAR